ncbi:hypothetical protein VPH35_065805 [Triticum aestivum]
MEVVRSLLKPKPTPRQQLHEWQRHLRNEGRNIEHQIRDVQKEEKKVEKAIRDAAKELVQSRKAVNHLYKNKARLNSISMHLGKIIDRHEDLAEVDVGQEDHQALVQAARSCSSPRLASHKRRLSTLAFVANNTRMLHN